MFVHHKGELVLGGPSNGDRVPLVVAQSLGRVILDGDDAVAEIDDVVDVAVDQLDGQKVLTFSGVVHQKA